MTQHDELLAMLGGIAKHLRAAYPLLQADADYIENAAAAIRDLTAKLEAEIKAHTHLEGDRIELQAKIGHLEQQLQTIKVRIESAIHDPSPDTFGALRKTAEALA